MTIKRSVERFLMRQRLHIEMALGRTSFHNPMYQSGPVQEARHRIIAGLAFGDVLEIGSLMGASALAMAASSHVRRVTCIDPWFQLRTFRIFLHNVEVSGASQRIHPIRSTSQHILPLFQLASFDTIYIDGDHSEEGVRFDIRQARRLIRPLGRIIGDDYDIPDVKRAVDSEFSASRLHADQGLWWI